MCYSDKKWYNGRNMSTLSPQLFRQVLTDIRQNWLIWNHDPNESYVLHEPDVEDQSMGQSAVIRDIFEDKVVKQVVTKVPRRVVARNQASSQKRTLLGD